MAIRLEYPQMGASEIVPVRAFDVFICCHEVSDFYDMVGRMRVYEGFFPAGLKEEFF